MAEIHIRRIKAVLKETFGDYIDLSDVKSEQDRERQFLTRSQAAFVISHLADTNVEQAAGSIVDGFDDNGIDAIHFDRITNAIYLVQSKWDESGNHSPDLGSVSKFINGIRDLLHARFDKFNKKVEAKREDILKALDSVQVRFVLVIVYTGTQPLSTHAARELDEFLKAQNDTSEFMDLKVYDQQLLMKAITGAVTGESINLEVSLYDWGEISEPYQAVYGQIPAVDIAQWYKEHDTKLLARNLRTYKGDTEVNQAIKATLTSDAFNFWYFNNGITVLCNSIEKTPRHGSNRNVGTFVCRGASVVNGAQTVGSIAEVHKQGFRNIDRARVLVRFISLENCPPGFGARVTTATNTQNQVFPRDFAALDPNQERLKTELWYDLHKSYFYRGETNLYPDTGCTVEEAAVALACAYGNVILAVHAKRELSKLFENIKREPYTLIFNEELSSIKMWNCVQIFRIVEDFLQKKRPTLTGAERLVSVHGNRFILYRVFATISDSELTSVDWDSKRFEKWAAKKAAVNLSLISQAIEKNFEGVYINGLFKSGAQCNLLEHMLPRDPDTKPRQVTISSATQQSLFDALGPNSLITKD
jgi:hypothetical protein